jgi:hypothetical protein
LPISKSDGGAVSPIPGTSITYTIVVSDTGSSISFRP